MINWRLWIGLLFVGFLFFIAVFGPDFAPYTDDQGKLMGFVQTSHGKVFMRAPFPPSPDHWFGTGPRGIDILSLLLYGAKYTIFTSVLVALARVLIGGLLGLWGGMYSKSEKSKSMVGAIGSIPSFLIVYFVMVGISINPSLSIMKLSILLAALMTFVGIPGIYSVVRAKTSEVKKSLYVEASVTLGGKKLHLIRKHIFPHLKGNFIVLFVNEIILTLGLLGQLGIFHVFMGGAWYHSQGLFLKYMSKTHEWAGMIGQERFFVFGFEWVLFYPLCAVAFSILSFYLLSRGLELRQRIVYQKYPYI